MIFLVFMGGCSLITKGIYRAKLPRVTTTSAREMALYHPVSVVGSVAAGQEYGIYVPAGLRVATIAVQKGNNFQIGDPLIQLDVEDLENILVTKELEQQRLIYQQKEAESQNVQNRQEDAKTLTRAQEDYETARRNGELQVSRAREELAMAQAELAQARKELERIRQQEKQNVNMGQNDGAGQGTEPSGSVSTGDSGTLTDNTESSQNKDLTAEIQQLETRVNQYQQAVRMAEQTVEDALLAQADGLQAAQRSVDDARVVVTYSAAADLARLEQDYLEKEIMELQELLEAEGWIYARENGRITALCVSTGQRTSDTAQLLYTPDDGQRLLQAHLTEEQTKYVSIGTRMQLTYETVSRGRQNGEGIVSYMETLENGITLIQLDVTEQAMEPGQKVTLRSTWQSESYGLVVPVSVLQKDSNNHYFLYMLRQQNGILGTEWHASLLYVNVLDQNNSYAAIESATLSTDTDIILTASADLTDNAVVRVVE